MRNVLKGMLLVTGWTGLLTMRWTRLLSRVTARALCFNKLNVN